MDVVWFQFWTDSLKTAFAEVGELGFECCKRWATDGLRRRRHVGRLVSLARRLGMEILSLELSLLNCSSMLRRRCASSTRCLRFQCRWWRQRRG